jgi:membrane-bound ClpP family serine protease
MFDITRPGVYEIVNGLCALIASLLIFKITGNFWGWLVLFAPGTWFVLLGLVKSLKSSR